MNPLNDQQCVDLRCISDWLRRERVIWAAATAATLDESLSVSASVHEMETVDQTKVEVLPLHKIAL